MDNTKWTLIPKLQTHIRDEINWFIDDASFNSALSCVKKTLDSATPFGYLKLSNRKNLAKIIKKIYVFAEKEIWS